MKLEGEQILLRVYLCSTDKRHWYTRPAVEVLVERARKEGLTGATLLHGFFGLDAHGHLLEQGTWTLAERVPVIVEIIDSAQAVGQFLTAVDEVLPEGLATLERGHVLLYRQNRQALEQMRTRLQVPEAIVPLSTVPSAEEFPAMRANEDGQLLRVFIGESDVWQGEPLYRAIVLKARALGLCGATVLKGPMGFGANSRLHTTGLLELSTDLPVIIEIVDSAEKIQTLLPFLDEVVAEGLITIETVRVLRYRADRGRVSRTGGEG